MSEGFFFDTYAIFEILQGSPPYKAFALGDGLTTIFNLAELNYAAKRQGKAEADHWVRECASSLTDVTVTDVMEAMSLRVMRRALSIPDAIGYVVAKRLGLRFLTGDKEFRDMDNVEFVK